MASLPGSNVVDATYDVIAAMIHGIVDLYHCINEMTDVIVAIIDGINAMIGCIVCHD